MSERLWILIPLIAGCAAVLVVLGLGLRGFGIERREGLTPSRRRVGALALLALAALGLTGWTIWATRAPDAPAKACLLYTSPSPRDRTRSRMPSSA